MDEDHDTVREDIGYKINQQVARLDEVLKRGRMRIIKPAAKITFVRDHDENKTYIYNIEIAKELVSEGKAVLLQIIEG